MKRAGAKTKEWASTRAALKVRFARAGITTCEMHGEKCWRSNALGFAHLKKRRNLSPAELEEVVLLCGPCHDGVERLPESVMGEALRDIIDARQTPV